MIRGYVSSDEDDYDDYDFGYEPNYIEPVSPAPVLPNIQSEEFKLKLNSAMEKSQQIEVFLNAVNEGNLTTMEELIGLGVSCDCEDSQGWTPLIKACGLGNVEVVEFLLEHGADPNKHRELFTPLMTCCTYTLVPENEKLACANTLLNHGANVNAKDKYQTTALMYAAGSAYRDIVARFLEVPDINVNIQDKEGWTAIFYAVNQNQREIVSLLQSAGTDLSLLDKYHRKAVTLALDKNLKGIAEQLGYVEEVVRKRKSGKNPVRKFLTELPDAEGNGGFESDAKVILSAFNTGKLSKKISLPALLNATDEDLHEWGVKLQPIRDQILHQGIHRYHLHPWTKGSRHEIVKGVPLTIEDAIAITGGMAKSLTIMNATVKYLKRRISQRTTTTPVDITTEKKFVALLVDNYEVSEKLKVILKRIEKFVSQVNLENPADFIPPRSKKKQLQKSSSVFWYIFGIASAALIMYKYNSVRAITN